MSLTNTLNYDTATSEYLHGCAVSVYASIDGRRGNGGLVGSSIAKVGQGGQFFNQ
jgi:hypothetical protein